MLVFFSTAVDHVITISIISNTISLIFLQYKEIYHQLQIHVLMCYLISTGFEPLSRFDNLVIMSIFIFFLLSAPQFTFVLSISISFSLSLFLSLSCGPYWEWPDYPCHVASSAYRPQHIPPQCLKQTVSSACCLA